MRRWFSRAPQASILLLGSVIPAMQALVKNKDGSVRLVFSPKQPGGVPDANWIQTNPEKGFFAYFRWYSPTKAFFDRSWKMGNIVEVK